MITAESAIEAINETISELNAVYDLQTFSTWRTQTIDTLKFVVPNDPSIPATISQIRPHLSFGNANALSDAKVQAEKILQTYSKNIMRFGFKSAQGVTAPSTAPTGFNINLSQHNHQTQNLSIQLHVIIEAIKKDINTSQWSELEEILKSGATPEEKKRTFVEKVKSFGSDVASNILANIVTNPSVYEKMGDLF